MDFVISLPILTNWKSENYDFILVVIDYLTKILYYESVKVTIDTSGPAEVIINIEVYYHNIPKLIVINWALLFISKF